VDLDAVRTFVAIVEGRRFQEAAVELSITQQAVSKRIAALERELGVALFTRTPRGARLTVDGRAFLPHARDLLAAQARALASVRPESRPLRVDVIGRYLAPAALMREFHRAHAEAELDVVTLADASAAVAAVAAGAIDAAFRAVDRSPDALPEGVTAARVLDEPVHLLVGPRHPLADVRVATPEALVGHAIWMPGLVAGSEWAAYYNDLAARFGLTLDSSGPNFGLEPLLDKIAASAGLATFVGAQTYLVWPSDYDLRRIVVHDPTPVYPHSLVWRRDNAHPALAALREHLAAVRPRTGAARETGGVWAPDWA
jgi:DNA-binding transcriptional LysR family regulator